MTKPPLPAPPQPERRGPAVDGRPPGLPARLRRRAARRSASRSWTRSTSPSARTSSRPIRPAADSTTPRWTGTRSASQDVAGASPDSRYGCRWSGRSPPARGAAPAVPGHRDEDHDRRAGARPAPTRSSPYERTDRGAEEVQGLRRQRTRASTSAGRARTSRRATVLFAEGEQLGPRRIGLLAGDRPGQGDGPAAAPGGGDRHRIGAGRAGPDAAEPQHDLRLQLLPAGRRGRAPPARRPSGSAWSATTPSRSRQLISDQLVRADLILTTGGVSQGDYDVVKAVMPGLGACRLRPGGHAARKAAGLRPDRRRPGPDDHAARQPGQRVRLLRGVRSSGDPQADGHPTVRPGRGAVPGGPRDDLDSGRRQLARGIVSYDAGRRRSGWPVGTGRTCWRTWPGPTRWSSCPRRWSAWRPATRSTSGCWARTSSRGDAPFPHLTSSGEARMVDVSRKAVDGAHGDRRRRGSA